MKYKFSSDFKVIEAYDDAGFYNAGFDYSKGVYLGKRKKSVETRPSAFSPRVAQFYAENLEQAFMKSILTKLAEDIDWFVMNPNYYIFVKDTIERGLDQLAPLVQNYGGLIYKNLVSLEKETLDEIDIELLNYGLSHEVFIANFVNMRLDFNLLKPILERSEMCASLANCIRYCQPENNEKGPSLYWVASIYRALINDGLSEASPIRNMNPIAGRSYTRATDVWLPLAFNYYFNLYALNEHLNPPIEENVLMDYARTEAMCEAISQNKMQTLIDSAKICHNPVILLNNENQSITYTQVTDVDQLIKILPTLSNNIMARKSIQDVLNKHGFLVIPSQGCPFAIDEFLSPVSIVRGITVGHLQEAHKNYLDYLTTL